MPTLGIDVKTTLATKNARTNLYSFYRGLEVNEIKQGVYSILPTQSHTLDLTRSNYLILTAIVDALDVEITNIANEIQTIKNCGILILNAMNLKQAVITNKYTDVVDVTLFY